MSKPSNSLGWRLGRAFLLQATLISVVAVLSVFAAGFSLQEILMKQALRDEAEHFWQRYQQNPDFSPPATQNLTGYLAASSQADSMQPHYLNHREPGFHGLNLDGLQHDFFSNALLYITERNQQRLYLVFNNEQVVKLAIYFGLVPLAGILIVLYLGAWLAYRMSRRAISPIIWLAEEVNRLDPQAPDSSVFASDRLLSDGHNEVIVLASAIKGFAERLNSFVERERNFTRDASHELRSPLTVIKMSVELLAADTTLSEKQRQSLQKIKQYADEMEDLVNVFLLLARESSDDKLQQNMVCINDIVSAQLQQAQLLAADKPITADTQADGLLLVRGPVKVLSILIGNLIRNAFSYTDAGRVQIVIKAHELVIEDSGVGIPEQQVQQVFRPYFRGSQPRSGPQRGGYGVGLTIVKRLSDQFNWPVSIESKPGIGTRVIVQFPRAEYKPRDSFEPVQWAR